jgi:predicted nucleotidyltransferase
MDVKKTIHENINALIPQCRIILFGSRTKAQAGATSDYDLLVITEQSFPVVEERHLSSLIRKLLASLDIDADVVVKSERETDYYRHKPGSIVREALKEGLLI